MTTIEIERRSASERIWVNRSTRGQYVGHFLEHGLAAIGHLDKFNLGRNGTQSRIHHLTNSRLEELLSSDAETSKAQRTSHLSQIRQFLSEMAVGNLIVTLDSSTFAVGRISGHPYFDDSPLPLQVGRELKSLPYQLRIPVAWGPRFPRQNLPLPLERVFYSHRTVFEISDYWQYIYHLIFPAFIENQQLFLSLFIGQPGDIRSKDISRLLAVLTEIETLAAELVGDNYSESLTLKASFFSEGPFWPRLMAGDQKAILVAAALVMIVGGVLTGAELKTPAGTLKIQGVLNTEAAKIFSEKVMDIIKINNLNDSSRRLELKIPSTRDRDAIAPQNIAPTNSQTIFLA